jgi:tRNA A58 N-methylase Trm61
LGAGAGFFSVVLASVVGEVVLVVGDEVLLDFRPDCANSALVEASSSTIEKRIRVFIGFGILSFCEASGWMQKLATG